MERVTSTETNVLASNPATREAIFSETTYSIVYRPPTLVSPIAVFDRELRTKQGQLDVLSYAGIVTILFSSNAVDLMCLACFRLVQPRRRLDLDLDLPWSKTFRDSFIYFLVFNKDRHK